MICHCNMENGMPQFEFFMRGKTSDGVTFSPQHVPINELSAYIKEIQKFLVGSDKKIKADIPVTIDEGSVKVVPFLTVTLALLLGEQLELANNDISKVDPVRTDVLRTWAENAKKNPVIEYEIKTVGDGKSVLKITKDSKIFPDEKNKWVAFEEYLIGEIVEAGGISNSNIHVRVSNQSKTITVDVDSNTLKNIEENLIYHKKVLRISGEKNMQTGFTRSLKLLEIKDPPRYNEEKIKKLISSARESWHGFDAYEWLNGIRG